MITEDIKARIIAAIKENRELYPSDAKHAKALGMSSSVYSLLMKGQTDKTLSEANYISVARRLGVNIRNTMEWHAAKTATFEFITTQLEACQDSALSVILCDEPNIGKTFTARLYVKNHRNAVYVDCSQVKTKRLLIRHIAREFGVNARGSYHEVYEDLKYYLRTCFNSNWFD